MRAICIIWAIAYDVMVRVDLALSNMDSEYTIYTGWCPFDILSTFAYITLNRYTRNVYYTTYTIYAGFIICESFCKTQYINLPPERKPICVCGMKIEAY